MLDSFRQFLDREYDRRLARNHRYSKRAFARDIGVSKSLLHEVFAGRKGVSLKTMSKITDNLKLSPIEKKQVLNTLAYESRNDLSPIEFHQICDWFYFAILSLATLPKASAEASWVSDRLGIPLNTAKEAIDKLVQLNLLKVEDQQLQRTKIRLNADWGKASRSLKHLHSQNLMRAEEALFETPTEARLLSSITTAISKTQFEKANKEIQNFQKKMMKLMDDSMDAQEVYTLAIQLFPQTKGYYEAH